MELIGKSLSNFLIYDRTTPPTKLVYLKLTNIQAQLKMSSFMFAISSLAQTYDKSYSKIIRRHKYKDKDNDKDNDKDKDTEKVPEKPNICYIFEILMTYSFQI